MREIRRWGKRMRRRGRRLGPIVGAAGEVGKGLAGLVEEDEIVDGARRGVALSWKGR